MISSDLPRAKGDPTAYLAWHPRPDPPTEAWRQAIWNVIHAAPGQFVDLLSTKLLSGKQCSRNALDPAPMSAHKHAGHHLQPVEVAAVKFFGHQRDLATIFIVRALRGTKKLDLGFGPGRRGLADLDRPGRTASLRTSEARSAGGVPIDGKGNKGPSQPVFVRCFGERRIWWWECDHDYADTAGNDKPASSASV